MNGGGSACGSPSVAVAAAGNGWRQSGVLGDAYRPSHGGTSSQILVPERRAMSASTVGVVVAGARSRNRLPRTPRPARTLQMFNCVKRGLQECVKVVQEEISRLRDVDLPSSSPSYQPRHIEIEKQIKLAERQKKRLEFHMLKLEELEENYVLHQQLREGVKTMTKAFISHPGSSKKLSIQNVERGHKECIQTMCLIEAQLEGLLGYFHCSMTGLSGFARLIPGDTCVMRLRHGAQKWKSRGKISECSQMWDPKTVVLKALVAEDFAVKVVEVKSLGKHVLIGEKILESKQLFSCQPQAHSISLNTTGSVRLNLLTHWIPLDGIDDSMVLFAMTDVHRRPQLVHGETPRKQLPIRSMVECETQPLLYWQNFTLSSSFPSSSSAVSSRYSVPVFPADARSNSSSSGLKMPCTGSLSSGELLPVSRQQPHCSSEDVGCRKSVYRDERSCRPHSMYVISSGPSKSAAIPKTVSMTLQAAAPGRWQQSAATSYETGPAIHEKVKSDGSLLAGKTLPPSPPYVTRPIAATLSQRQQKRVHDFVKSPKPLLNLLYNLQTELHHHRRGDEPSSSELILRLAGQLDRLAPILQMNSVRRESEESNSIETVLEAFSFLESVDYDCDNVEDDTSDDEEVTSQGLERSSRRQFGAKSPMNTTDSGIGSIANREQTRERRSRSDSRILGSCGLVELSTAASMESEVTTDMDQLKVALRWHIIYCTQLAKKLRTSEIHSETVASSARYERELELQTVVFKELTDLLTNKEFILETLQSFQSGSNDVINFWLDCCGERVYCSSELLIDTLIKHCASHKLPSMHCNAFTSEYLYNVLKVAVSDIVGSDCYTTFRGKAEESFMTQTVTFHQFLFYMQEHCHDTIESFLSDKFASRVSDCATESETN